MLLSCRAGLGGSSGGDRASVVGRVRWEREWEWGDRALALESVMGVVGGSCADIALCNYAPCCFFAVKGIWRVVECAESSYAIVNSYGMLLSTRSLPIK